jgi:mono/diheme cytochrome c family protein
MDRGEGRSRRGATKGRRALLRNAKLLCLIVVAGAQGVVHATRAADAPAGQTAWAKTCQQCHGAPTEGAEGPALIPLAHTPDQIRDIVRFGNGEMKALATSSITDADLDAVIAYLQSLDKKGK